MRNEQWAIKLNEILIFAYSMVSIESLVEVFSAELELETESKISHFIPIYFPFFPIFYLGKPSSWFEPMTCLLLANVIRIRPVCCMIHCAKRVQIRSFSWSVLPPIWTEYGEIRSKKTPYLDSFHVVISDRIRILY